MTRPKDWDDKYGPWGTPPDYTPPMTVTNNIQSPLGLRIGSAFFAICVLTGIWAWTLIASSGEQMSGKIIFGLFVMIGLSSYMTWWCLHLSKRRENWLRENKTEQQKQTEDQS